MAWKRVKRQEEEKFHGTPDHVDRYTWEEVGFEAMLGPLDNNPFDVHISSFMTREKSDSDSRRTIMDLSFPKGLSVNNNTFWVQLFKCIILR